MPLFCRRSPSPLTSFASEPLKAQKSPPPPSPPSRFPLPITVFSILCFSFGLVGTIFAVTVLRRPTPLHVFRCAKSDDTFRAFYSTSTSRKLGGNGGLIDRPKFLGFVGIQTGFNSGDRRAALRTAWFPSDPDGLLRLEQATGLAFSFVTGRTKNSEKRSQLDKEIQKYKDFMILDIEEEYLSLPRKTLEFFKAAFILFEADYYVKADDAIYLRPDRLSTLLAKERTHSTTYIGCMKKGPVITDPKMKWYEKSGHVIGNEYFSHAYSPKYILSAEVVASLSTARNNSLRMFNHGDVTIGSWVLAMNVHHEDNRAICEPQCTPTSIAVWDIPKCSVAVALGDYVLYVNMYLARRNVDLPGLCNPATTLKELHDMNMCSKSPTIPLDNR